MSNRQWYEDYQKDLHDKQDSMTRDEVLLDLLPKSEGVFDPETALSVNHKWVDRGLKWSCEGATHPMHQAWKRSKVASL